MTGNLLLDNAKSHASDIASDRSPKKSSPERQSPRDNNMFMSTPEKLAINMSIINEVRE